MQYAGFIETRPTMGKLMCIAGRCHHIPADGVEDTLCFTVRT